MKRARDAKQIETVTLRYGGFYGPQVASMQAVLQMLRARRLFLPRGANGIMPFVHVDDAAAATIAALEDTVLATSADAATAPIHDLGSAAFMVDLASMAHETQYTRLFRS